MDKTLAGVIGALGAMAAVAPAHASVANALQATSYRELLERIPNASATLRAIDETDARVELAQLVVIPRGYDRHHHHHHHRYYRPRYHHHHHHHHHGYDRR